MSYYAGRAWTPMPYAETVHYRSLSGFGADPACDSAAEGVSGAQAARSQDWSRVVSGGDVILAAESGQTLSGAASCDVAAYNEGYLDAWQLRCITQSGTFTETADGYQCHIPKTQPVPSPTPQPLPSPAPAPAPAPAPDNQAQIASGPLFIAGALLIGVLVWKVFA